MASTRQRDAGNTQNALASVYYHLGNVERIESGVEAIIDSSRLRESQGRLLSAGGNTIAFRFGVPEQIDSSC